MKENITDQELKNLLQQSKPEFKPFFSTRVLAKIEHYDGLPLIGYLIAHRLMLRRYLYAGAFGLLLLLAVTYIQDGSVSIDHLLGLGSFSEDDIMNYVNPVI